MMIWDPMLGRYVYGGYVPVQLVEVPVQVAVQPVAQLVVQPAAQPAAQTSRSSSSYQPGLETRVRRIEDNIAHGSNRASTSRGAITAGQSSHHSSSSRVSARQEYRESQRQSSRQTVMPSGGTVRQPSQSSGGSRHAHFAATPTPSSRSQSGSARLPAPAPAAQGSSSSNRLQQLQLSSRSQAASRHSSQRAPTGNGGNLKSAFKDGNAQNPYFDERI